MKDIELAYQGRIHRIPNRWEGMSSDHYISLVADLLHMAGGQLSAGEVRINHLLHLMGWDKRKFRTEEQIANLVAISEQLTRQQCCTRRRFRRSLRTLPTCRPLSPASPDRPRAAPTRLSIRGRPLLLCSTPPLRLYQGT